ncbi:deoxycytidylate deaminase [Telmatospirillum siberiense]|uniref:CMP deaminase n=1 Tax=Telmatospirillum siberiense TaxID=382514 RepID=A0A2N3PSU3_9PROT|nr:deaminase [Telmatospirillum siberiense]PKU23462.1 CMP deaminase [Telmatospirillum siberiense]
MSASPSAWDSKFLALADFVAGWSKDPSTQVGAVAVGETPNLLSLGYNGFPPGVADLPDRLNDRDTKYRLVVHGEINALINAQFRPVTLYVTHPPCVRCTVQILAYRSVRRVVSRKPGDDMLSRWSADFSESRLLFEEAGVSLELF